MPPKQKPNKAEEKKKQEALKDRTFGLKNKKLRAQLEKNVGTLLFYTLFIFFF
jgi:hypothetical protein